MNVLEKIKSYKRNYSIKKILMHDINIYAPQYASSMKCELSGDRAARDILVYCHVVEKGLSHKNLRPLFGIDRVRKISSALKEYVAKGGRDLFIINIAISTLNEYNTVNIQLGVAKEKLVDIPDVGNIRTEQVNVGVDIKSREEYFSFCGGSFSQICEHRHSIRLYDSKSDVISEQEILDCIKIAQKCPSACNRQAVRIKIIINNDLKNKVCEIQGGSAGFGENSGAILIVTADISLYEPSERRMPMLDCGLFIMNLLYAFYEKRIGTCILNGSFSLEREIEMRKVAPIPENEMYAAVIALSKIPEGEEIKVAHSVKRKVNDIVDFL